MSSAARPAPSAYAIVRVTEAFIYNHAICAVEPEVEAAARVVETMLA